MQGSLVAALRHPCEGVKVAACACVRSLSRSVKVVCASPFFYSKLMCVVYLCISMFALEDKLTLNFEVSTFCVRTNFRLLTLQLKLIEILVTVGVQQNLRTSLTSEQFVRPLLQLMNDSSPAVQVVLCLCKVFWKRKKSRCFLWHFLQLNFNTWLVTI